ncbi:hypothetical protein BDR06DRAFT_976765 [Suillus hirtellus]|nr:hypothetical protein BDR06DRAFT_976765 [Suillus hirtellus]
MSLSSTSVHHPQPRATPPKKFTNGNPDGTYRYSRRNVAAIQKERSGNPEEPERPSARHDTLTPRAESATLSPLPTGKGTPSPCQAAEIERAVKEGLSTALSTRSSAGN